MQTRPTVPHIANPFPLWKAMGAVGLSKASRDRVMSRLKDLRAPGESRARRELANRLEHGDEAAAVEHMRVHGWAGLEAGVFGDARPLARELRKVFDDVKGRGLSEHASASRKGSFLCTLLHDADFFDHPQVLDFITSPALLRFAAGYLGEAPVLSGVSLWWSPPNTSQQASQLYHRDEEDDRQIKVFINVTDVNEANGPFTLVSAAATQRCMERAGHRFGRFSDDEVAVGLDGENEQEFTGKAGAMAAVDTSRCLHFGSRGNSKDRVVIMFQFTRFAAPRSTLPRWGERLDGYLAGESDPLRRRAFLRR